MISEHQEEENFENQGVRDSLDYSTGQLLNKTFCLNL